MIPNLRHVGPVRLAYVAGLIGRIVLGYSLLSLRKRTMTQEAYGARLKAQHLPGVVGISFG